MLGDLVMFFSCIFSDILLSNSAFIQLSEDRCLTVSKYVIVTLVVAKDDQPKVGALR